MRDNDVHSLLVEEMFPISSDLVLEEEKLRHYEVLSTYGDCLSKGPWDLGTTKDVRYTIDTGSAKPIQVPPRRVLFHKRQEMRSQVDEILEAEIIIIIIIIIIISFGDIGKLMWQRKIRRRRRSQLRMALTNSAN